MVVREGSRAGRSKIPLPPTTRLRHTERQDEARAMLAEVYNWFTRASTPPT
jgi:hypothetical protein